MTKDEIILHAGLHKTGSTSIQATLNGYDDGEMKYARLGSANHSKFLDHVFSTDQTEKWWHEEGAQELERWRAKVMRELDSKWRRLVFSAERLSTLGEKDAAAMLETLRPYAARIRFIAYARDPASYIASSLQQRIKFGSAEFRLPNQRPFFRERLAHYFELLPRDAVDIVPFLTFSEKNRDVVEDFCARIGAKVPPERIVRNNESLSAEAVRLVYIWNREGGDKRGGKARRRMFHILREHFPGRFRLSRSLTMERVDWDDVDWLEGMIGERVADRDAGVAEAPDVITCEEDLLALSPGTEAKLAEVVATLEPDAGATTVPELMDALHRYSERMLLGDPDELRQKRERREKNQRRRERKQAAE